MMLDRGGTLKQKPDSIPLQMTGGKAEIQWGIKHPSGRVTEYTSASAVRRRWQSAAWQDGDKVVYRIVITHPWKEHRYQDADPA